MKNSWRVGIPEEKTALVTSGIYNFSRNPAFVGFDLLYLSLCLMFFNIPLIVISIFSAAMLHIQILQEEEYMHITFGAEYDEYKKYTMRYLGRRVINEN
jgi:protein-S-isoprenylcysteine O-methyltransferase Ste14